MRFDIDRLSQLAGIKGDSRQLREASNRSYHDGVANDTADERFGKNQLSELTGGRGAGHADPLAQYEGDGLDEDEDFTTKKTSKRKKHGAKGKPFWGDKEGDREGPDEGLSEADDDDKRSACEKKMAALKAKMDMKWLWQLVWLQQQRRMKTSCLRSMRECFAERSSR